jgi:integrase
MQLVRKRTTKTVNGVKRTTLSRYWYAECRDLNGRRYWKSTKQTDKAAAARAARSIDVAGSVPRLQKYSLAAALLELAKHKERKRVSAAELEILKQKGGRLIEHFGPGRDLNAIEPPDVDGYVDERRKAEVRPGKRLSDETIRMELKYLREAARHAKRAGRYEGDPSKLTPTVLAPRRPRVRWLTYEQFLALIGELRDDRDGRARNRAELADYVIAWCHTGARRAELFRLTAANLDRRGRRLFIAGRKGSINYQERWVPLSEAAFEVLDRRAKAVPAGAPLFKTTSSNRICRVLATACRRCGMDPVTPNDCRRSYATWHLTAGSPEREVQKFMGHSPHSPLVRKVYGQIVSTAGQAAVASFPAPPKVAQGVAQTKSASGGQTDGSADEPESESA